MSHEGVKHSAGADLEQAGESAPTMSSRSGVRDLLLFDWRWTALLPALLVYAQPAYAHVQKGEAIGFLSGLHHPISGLDHVLAMIAVGLWGAQLGAPAVWLLPVCFPIVMAMGGMLGLLGVHVPGIEIGIAASAILLGAAVMSEARPPLMVAAALVAFFAIFHGYAHGHRVAGRREQPALQHGFRHRHRLLARGRDYDW